MFGHPKTKRGWAHLEAHENDQSGAHGRAPTVVMGPRANKMAKYSASSTTCTNSMNVQAPLYYEPTATRGAGPAAVVVAFGQNLRREHTQPSPYHAAARQQRSFYSSSSSSSFTNCASVAANSAAMAVAAAAAVARGGNGGGGGGGGDAHGSAVVTAAGINRVQHQSSDNYRRRHHRPANSGVAAAASAAAVSAITSSEGMDSTEDDLHLPFGSDIDGNGEAWNVYIQERGGGDDEL